MESLLTTAEKFSALAVASGVPRYYPERDLDEAWKIVLRNQFHDILDGSSIGPVYDEVRPVLPGRPGTGPAGPRFLAGNNQQRRRYARTGRTAHCL